MYCWKCGKELLPGAVFCAECGADQRRRDTAAPEGPKTQATPPRREQSFTAPPTGQAEQPKEKKKSGRDWTAIILGIVLLLLGYMNYRDMHAGDMYTVIFGIIPAHWVLFPGGLVFAIGGIWEMIKGK